MAESVSWKWVVQIVEDKASGKDIIFGFFITQSLKLTIPRESNSTFTKV